MRRLAISIPILNFFAIMHVYVHYCDVANSYCDGTLTELGTFLKTLDERVELEKKNSKRHTTERLERVEGSVIHSFPPAKAPSWCVDKEWLKGTLTMAVVQKCTRVVYGQNLCTVKPVLKQPRVGLQKVVL